MWFQRLCGISLLVLAASVVLVNPTSAVDLEGKTISEIKTEGNQTIAGDEIIAWLSVKPGDRATDSLLLLDRDLKEIWKTGKFEDVAFFWVPLSDGTLRLVIQVQERPLISAVQFEGQQAFAAKDLAGKIDLKSGMRYDPFTARQAAQKIADFYREKEYYRANVTPVAKVTGNQVDLVFSISEGLKVKVVKIEVEGNKAFSAPKIKGLMETKEAGWFVGGTFKEEIFMQDLKKILFNYAREGYLKAKLFGFGLQDIDLHREQITEQALGVNQASKEMTIRLRVEEGAQFTLGQVSLRGNIIYSAEDLLGRMELKTGKIFDLLGFEKDLQQIRSAYSEKGYIFTDVAPDMEYLDDAGMVNVVIQVREGTIARVERIDIRGNTITKDKVVRRELTLKPGEPFDSRQIQRSREKIMNLGFFQDVKVTTEPGSTEGEQVLVLEVEERHTGTISLGAGYSSVDQLMGYLQLSQANLFGNGQSVSLQWELGNLRQSWQMSFTEPWLFDSPVSFGVDVWNINKRKGYNSQGYNLLSQGGDIRLGRRFDEWWKGYLTYKLESNEYTDLDPDIQTQRIFQEGRSDTSSLTPTLVYDTRDNVFDPTTGTNHRLSVEFAGGPLGGDNNFLKYSYDGSYYLPLIWKLVLALHGEVGFAHGFEYGVTGYTDVPPSELYRVGGTDSVRGYGEGVFGAIGDQFPLGGGRTKIVGNVELHYPIVGPLKGVAFFDAGNVWNDWDELVRSPYLNKGVGLGVRLTIPGTVILIRFDFGYPLDNDPDNKPRTINYHFNIGNIF